MGIISGLGSFRGQFGDHFRVRDHFGVGIISGAVQTQTDHFSKAIAFAWAFAFAGWLIFKIVLFLAYLVFFRAVFCAEQL